MSGAASERLGLPMIEAGQAAKELTHNEALVRLDFAVQPSVVALGTNQPPPAPAVGAAWIVGAAPLGDWIGQAQSIAGWTASGWRFLNAIEGMSAWVADQQMTATFRAGAWRLGETRCARVMIEGVSVVQTRAAGIATPIDGDVVDSEARLAVSAILAALRHHGLIEM